MTETRHYFAYGANMSSEVLQRRRGLRPISAEAARLEGWRLVFEQPGIRFIEPVFASITAQAGCCVHGVLYRLPETQLARLNRTEGAGYELVDVAVRGDQSGLVEACTYLSKTPCGGRKPSRTYLKKLIRGAREHGLPSDYIERLRRVDTIHLPIVSTIADHLGRLALRRAASTRRQIIPLVKLGASARREGKERLAAPEVLLTARALTRSFHEGDLRRNVLSGAHLELRRGERLALLGRSGSGKSTLLNLIAGIDQADGGEIEMDGTNLTHLREPERTLFRRRHIGFVYQFFNLIDTLSVAENIALPLQLVGTPRATVAERTRAMLAAVGLAERGGDYPDQLSGGEQQRVAVARALVHRPALVLADEPTGNLDAESGRRVLDLLTGLSEPGGLSGDTRQTLLIVTHSLEVARAADRVIVLEGGQVRAAAGDFKW